MGTAAESKINAFGIILRENRLQQGLAALCDDVGCPCPRLPESEPDRPFALADIYDQEIEAAARACYQRDYMQFGFDRWGNTGTAPG